MKIGIFDSGLGGLYMLRSLLRNKHLAKYDYVFLGDTKNLPYGKKSQAQIYRLNERAVKFLFNQGCELVIIACNTSSAQALRRIQRYYLPKYFNSMKVLGVIRPSVELISLGDTCILGTTATIKAHAYTKELKKINPRMKVHELAAPELAELIETSNLPKIRQAVVKYSNIIRSKNVANVVLGCTHYAIVKDQFVKSLGRGIKLISQDQVLPEKLTNYLYRHQEIENKLTRKKSRQLYVTQINPKFTQTAKKWFGKNVKLTLAKI